MSAVNPVKRSDLPFDFREGDRRSGRLGGPVDISTPRAANLKNYPASLDDGNENFRHLAESIDELSTGARQAVSSLLGLSITVTVDGQDVTLTSMPDSVEASDIGSSLAVPLSAIMPIAGGVAVLYAGKPGSFVDLAADLRHVLQQADGELRMDENLLPPTLSGLTGAHELSTINKAIGVLIDRGFPPEDAKDELQRQARMSHCQLHQAAEQLLESMPNVAPGIGRVGLAGAAAGDQGAKEGVAVAEPHGVEVSGDDAV
jgi:hypothetical protein